MIDSKTSVNKVVALMCSLLMLSFFVEINNEANAQQQDFFRGRFQFVNVNMPASVLVGHNFTLTGKLVNVAGPLDKVYLSIDGSKNLWIYGDKSIDLGGFDAGTSERLFSFTLLSLQPGLIQVTLTATGIRDLQEIAKSSITVSTSSMQALTTLSFQNVNLSGDVTFRKINLTATIWNTGSFPADHVIVSLKAPGSMMSLQETIRNIDQIPTNSTTTVTWSLQSVQKDLTQMEIIAYASNANLTSVLVPINPLQIEVSSQLSFTSVSIPPGVTKDNPFYASYTITNIGSSVANDVFLSMEVPDGLLVLGNATNYAGVLKPGDTFGSAFRLNAVKSGSYNVRLIAFSSNNSPTSIPLTITVSDPNVRLAISSISTNPFYLYPGDVGDKINVGIINYGDETLEGVTAKLLIPKEISAAWSGSDRFAIPFLPAAKDFPATAQQFATFFVNIASDATSGSYQLGLSITDGHQNYAMDLPIVVMPKASFELQSVSYTRSNVFGSETVESISPGETSVVRVTLKNTGSAAADSVVSQLQTSNDFEGIRSDSSGTVGNIDSLGTILPNQVFRATFHMSVDGTVRPDVYPGTVLISWRQGDLSGNFTQALQLPIKVSTKPVTENIPYAQIFLGGISAVFLTLYLSSRRKKSGGAKGSGAAGLGEAET